VERREREMDVTGIVIDAGDRALAEQVRELRLASEATSTELGETQAEVVTLHEQVAKYQT
jgi:hypothetical protein